jgi:hypothetical protein
MRQCGGSKAFRNSPFPSVTKIGWVGLLVSANLAFFSTRAAAADFALIQSEAERGDCKAESRLADAYAGAGDLENAVPWYQKAADQGDAHAQWQLGRLYEFGGGCIAVDHKSAVAWYLKAATQGDAHAQLDLGQICERGALVKSDYLEAYRWYSLSAKQLPVLAGPSRDRVRSKLSPEEIQESDARVDSFATASSHCAARPTVLAPAAPKPLQATIVTNSPATVPPPKSLAARPEQPVKPAPTPAPKTLAAQSAPKMKQRTDASVAASRPAIRVDSQIASHLHLKGISAFGNRRSATINGRNVFQGEDAVLQVAGQTVRLRCAEIYDHSALVQVDGLNRGITLELVR